MAKKEVLGVWIPLNIWLISELSLIERIFLSQIKSLDNTKRGCYASNAYFSDLFGITKGRCSQIITSLKEKGFLKITQKYANNQVVERNIRVVNKLNTLVRKLNGVFNNLKGGAYNSKEGYLENAQVNNIPLNSIDYNSIIIEKDFELKKNNLEILEQKKIIEEQALLISDLKSKLEKKKKKPEPLHKDCKAYFHEYYFQEKKEKYYWSVKDSTNLNQIIKKIRAMETATTEESVFLGFQKLISSIKKCDVWVFDNFEPAMINLKFNALIDKIKANKFDSKKTNGNQPENYDWYKAKMKRILNKD